MQDIAVGTVLMELGGAKSGRLASLDAGYGFPLLCVTATYAEEFQRIRKLMECFAGSRIRLDSKLSIDNALPHFNPSPTSPSLSNPA